MEKNNQVINNLPNEILSLPRFVNSGNGGNPKAPYDGWNKPENQKLYSELNGIVGFVPSTKNDNSLIFYDFDHVLGDNGQFVNHEAEKWFNYLQAQEYFAELSQSGKGLHMFAAPTKGKFPFGRRELVFDNNAKLEIFYGTNKFCLVTGIPFRCVAKAPIANGEIADEMFQNVLNEIQKQSPTVQKNSSKPAPMDAVDTPDYDSFRARRMLDLIPLKDLEGSDWLAAMSALKNLGFSYKELDLINQGGKHYDEKENRKRFDSLDDPSFNIETLHGIAKRFGYAEKDSRRKWYELHPELKPSTKLNDAFFNALTDARADFEPFNGYDFLQDTVEDLDNARRLEKYRGNYIRWLTDDELWLTFDNGIWSRRSEKSSCLYPFATRFADQMMNFAKILGAEADAAAKASVIINDDGSIQRVDEQAKKKADIANARKEKAFAIAYYFKKRKNYSAAIDLLKGCDSILITAADLNRHKNLLCVKNGVIDLETGKLYPLDPKYLITNQADVFFDPNADITFVDKFFSEVIPDEPTRQGVLRYLGYCLTGEKNFHISQFWRGTGANGKSTILDALIRLLASYAVKLPCAALLESNRPVDGNSATPAIALLDGDIRFALVDELPRNSRLNAALYKTITGDETIAARPLYGNFRNIELRAKIILNGNHLPTFDVDDGGLQRRINNVEFNQKFEGDRADSDLPKKLATPENRSALLKILVHEAIEYYKDGLLESDAMKAAKAAYFAESDFVSEFVDEYCDIGDGFILRKEFIDKLKSEHYADTRRFSSQELFKAVCDSLARNGVGYGKNRLNQNIFKGISWRITADFGGKDISAKDYAMP